MVPFEVEVGGKRVGITFESLAWFFIVTMFATAAGTILYYYVQPYLPAIVTQASSAARTSAKQITTGAA